MHAKPPHAESYAGVEAKIQSNLCTNAPHLGTELRNNSETQGCSERSLDYISTRLV